MSLWTDKWNALPYEVRHIGSMREAEMRINQLLMEKGRIKKRYDQSMKEVNDHIRSLKKWIQEGGK